MTSIFRGAVLAIAIAGGATASSAATLIGNQIEAAYYFPTIGEDYAFASFGTNPFTIGAGVDATIDVEGVTDLLIDFSASSLVITLNTILTAPTWNAAAQNGPSFTVLSGNPFPAITSVASSNAGPVSASLVLGELIVNWAGMAYLDGDTVTITFADVSTPIPLPAGIGLLGLGLGALGWTARRRRAA